MAVFSVYYLYKIRQINLKLTTDTYRLKASLMSPVNSLVNDTLNGLTTMRALMSQDFFLGLLMRNSDVQAEAHVTSNAVNRWCAQRIDL